MKKTWYFWRWDVILLLGAEINGRPCRFFFEILCFVLKFALILPLNFPIFLTYEVDEEVWPYR